MDNEDAERPPVDTEDGRTRPASGHPVAVGRYTWSTLLEEHGHAAAAAALYDRIPSEPAVPRDAVETRLRPADDPPLRTADVERSFRTDGETPVPGHGTPKSGRVVVGRAGAVVSGSAIDPVTEAAATASTTGGGSEEDGDGAGDHAAGDGRSDPIADGDRVVVDARAVDPVPVGSPTDEDWDRVGVDPAEFLGFDPAETAYRFGAAGAVGDVLWDMCHARYNQYEVPVLKGYYTWENYADEFFRDEAGNPPTNDEDEPLSFTHEDKTEALGFDPEGVEAALSAGADAAAELDDLVDERTVDVSPEMDEDAFFSTTDGATTLANRYDLEKAVPLPKKTHFREIERYWVNKPFAFIIIFQSTKENEHKYYAVQPHMTRIETELAEFLTGKLRTSIKYADESIAGGDETFREDVIAEETRVLLDRYDLRDDADDEDGFVTGLIDRLDARRFGIDPTKGRFGRLAEALGYVPPGARTVETPRISARPEPAVLAEDQKTLSEYQVEKLLYYLKRDFIGYERIDPIKHDINVEDISCDGYESPVFVYHSDYEQIITNVYHGTDELDDFVVKLAQRSGKGISKRRPQVDATLPDGSRAQLTLGKEVSDHGTNYTIRQFNDIPFTPIDLINWKTFSLDQMAFLWLCIENNKNLIFAGGTASGKTTSLNAVSLFIPSNGKIVSIEDTREVELPQRNWIASVTRPSFSDDDKGDVDEFDLLEAALRQRPDYIVMGEIRGEEGRTAFQVMSTGHTTYTTFHADSVGEVLKRFTTDPINVSKTMFTALDLVSIQTSTRVKGRKVRRNKSLTEINHYDAENDEINVQDVYQWQAETDDFLKMGDSNVLEEIMFDRGWSEETLADELRKRRLVLAYLIDRGLNSYAQVAATFQAFINDPETVLALMANDELERSLEDLREMESVLIDVDREKEKMVPRPDPDDDGRAEASEILAEAEDLLSEYRGAVPNSVADALLEVDPASDVEARPDEARETLTETAREASNAVDEPASDDEPIPADEPISVDDGPDAPGESTPDGDAVGATGSDGIDFERPFGEGVDVGSDPADAGEERSDLFGSDADEGDPSEKSYTDAFGVVGGDEEGLGERDDRPGDEPAATEPTVGDGGEAIDATGAVDEPGEGTTDAVDGPEDGATEMVDETGPRDDEPEDGEPGAGAEGTTEAGASDDGDDEREDADEPGDTDVSDDGDDPEAAIDDWGFDAVESAEEEG